MRRFHDGFARLGPQTIAGHGVDFAVVRKETEGLRQLPLRPGIGREALVIDGERRFKARIAQVEIEHRQVFRRDQTLVGNDVRVQRGQVESRIGGIGFFGQTARGIELALESLIVQIGRAVHEHLFEQRQRLEGVFAASFDIGRHDAQAGEDQALRFNGGFQMGERFVASVENQAGGITVGNGEAGLLSHGAQKAVGLAEQQPATVARLAIGGDCATVGQASQRFNRRRNKPMRRLVVHLGNQAEAAAILFKFRAIQCALQPALSFHVLCNPCGKPDFSKKAGHSSEQACRAYR